MFHLLAAEKLPNPVLPQLIPAITAIVVFVIFFGVLRIVVWPKITSGLDERERKIRDDLKSAEEAREQAKREQEEHQKALEEAREEATDVIAKAKADAKQVADELRARNETELSEMKDRATRDIDAAKRSAINELHAEAATLAAHIAGKILKREISVEDQQRLVDESLSELGKVREN
jgi:F-type H+-transporting ATPase subunit b